MATYQEFAAKIKEKYPAYAKKDDLELAKAFVAKYPAYAEKVEFPKKGIIGSTLETLASPVIPLAAAMGVPEAQAALRRTASRVETGVAPIPNVVGLPGLQQQYGEQIAEAVVPAVNKARQAMVEGEEEFAAGPFGQKHPTTAGVINAATGLPKRAFLGLVEANAPFFTPEQMAGELGADVLLAGTGVGLSAAGKGIKKGLAALHTPKTAPLKAAETIAANPAITKPGYFKSRVDDFTEAIVSGWEKAQSKAKGLSKRVSEVFGKRPVISEVDMRSALTNQLNDLPATVLNDSAKMAELEPIFDSLNEAAKTVKTSVKVPRSVSGVAGEAVERQGGVALREVKSVTEKMTDFVNKHIGDPQYADLVNRVKTARTNINTIIESSPGAAGKASKLAREAHREVFQKGKEIKKVVGLAPDADPTDASTKAHVISWLRNQIKTGDKETLEIIEALAPGASKEAQQLAAVSTDQFAKIGGLLPSIGLANFGWAIENPEKSVKTAAILLALSLLGSPRVAGQVLRAGGKLGGVRSVPPAMMAGGQAGRILPGLIAQEEQ